VIDKAMADDRQALMYPASRHHRATGRVISVME
jgi:hypothetical protein